MGINMTRFTQPFNNKLKLFSVTIRMVSLNASTRLTQRALGRLNYLSPVNGVTNGFVGKIPSTVNRSATLKTLFSSYTHLIFILILPVKNIFSIARPTSVRFIWCLLMAYMTNWHTSIIADSEVN